MLKTTSTFVLALSALAMAPHAMAQERPIALTTSTYFVAVTADGEELVAPTNVVPGDTLEFTTRYANQSGSVITQFVVSNPVPENIALTAQAAGATEVSVDGGTVWGPLASLEIVEADGTRRAATAGDVTHLRWVIATLAPEEQGSVSYRGIVK